LSPAASLRCFATINIVTPLALVVLQKHTVQRGIWTDIKLVATVARRIPD
jgi:hypothetical protein